MPAAGPRWSDLEQLKNIIGVFPLVYRIVLVKLKLTHYSLRDQDWSALEGINKKIISMFHSKSPLK